MSRRNETFFGDFKTKSEKHVKLLVKTHFLSTGSFWSFKLVKSLSKVGGIDILSAHYTIHSRLDRKCKILCGKNLEKIVKGILT